MQPHTLVSVHVCLVAGASAFAVGCLQPFLGTCARQLVRSCILLRIHGFRCARGYLTGSRTKFPPCVACVYLLRCFATYCLVCPATRCALL
eukprot:3587570-Alexandrium_andersonii.AAC.1